MSLSIVIDGEAIEEGIPPSSVAASTMADGGETGMGGMLIEDPNKALTLLGHRPVIIEETACSQPRLFTGWTATRGQKRAPQDALVVDEARSVEINTIDLNALFGFRLLWGTSANRPEETWNARLAWILGSNYLLGLVEDDDTYCVASTLVMDAADYRDSYCAQVLADLCERFPEPHTYFAFRDPADGLIKVFLNRYDAAINDSSLYISNDLADVDNVTTFAPSSDTTLSRNPDETWSEATLEYNQGTKRLFRSRSSTATKYVRRGTKISRPRVGKFATASTQLTNFLTQHAGELDTITTTIYVPPAAAGLVIAGQRINVKLVHLDGYADWASLRVTTCTATPTDDSVGRYAIALELVAPRPGGVPPKDECSYEEPQGPGDASSLDVFGGSFTPAVYVPAASVYPSVATGQGGQDNSNVERIPYGTPNDGSYWGLWSCVLRSPYDAIIATWTWDLGTPTPICTWRLEFHGLLSGERMILRASDDNATWTTIVNAADLEAGQGVTPNAFGSPYPTYRYWQLYFYEVGGGSGFFWDGVEFIDFMLWQAGGEADTEEDQGHVPGTTAVETTDPTVDDDSDHGFSVGDHWLNTTSGTEFVLTDATPGAAVWMPTTAAASLALDDLSDVTAPAPDDGDLLSWDDGTGQWVNIPAPSGGVSEITDLPTAETTTALVLHPDGAGGVEWGTDATGGGGGDDPVADIFGTPDTAFEFTSSSLSGLTAIGTPDAEDADTTIPDCLYYRDDASSTAWVGRYLASPSTPFTAIVKLMDFNADNNYNEAGLLIGVSDPTSGAFVCCGAAYSSTPIVEVEKFSNPTTYSANHGNVNARLWAFPIWLAAVVNSTSSINYYMSRNGRVWRKFINASDPGFTVGSVGLGMKSEHSSGASAAFDFLRIWNSALTMP